MAASFMGRAFQMPWNTRSSLFSMARTANTSKQQFKSQFRQQYKRSFHSHSDYKRPNLSKTKWGVFDELKLVSYTSHLAFFMLLPPIIQMYTTKVEVTRDDTLTESSFASLEASNGLVIKNMNFLDILQSEKNKLMNLYLQTETNSASSERILPDEAMVISRLQKKSPVTKTALTTIKRRSCDPELDEQIKMLESAYSSLRKNVINDKQYMTRIESITDDLIGLRHRSDNEAINNTVMKVFDQLHSLRLHNYETVLFRRLLTSYQQPETKFLNIRQKIINNYEITKKIKSSKKCDSRNKIIRSSYLGVTPINEMMDVSIWLRSYAKNFERFAQLVHMFAATNQSKKAFHTLFHIGFDSNDVCNQIENPEQRYGLISALRSFNKEKEALFLERKMRKLVSN